VEAQQQFKMENQYSVQRKLARELEDLRGTLEEHMKKTGEYDKELAYQEKAAQESRIRLDRLQNESRRITDVSYSVKIDVQCKDREL
jgi:predicted nuclease with TOPRIM domain